MKARMDNAKSSSAKRKAGRNDELALGVLARARRALTAYDILGELKRFGISGPPTVYRALEKLVQAGQVHRIQSLNAYVACRREKGCTHTHHNTFAVCGDCGSVEEIHDDRVASLIRDLGQTHKFTVEQDSLELIGHCGACSKKKA